MQKTIQKLILLPQHVPTHACGAAAVDTIAGSALQGSQFVEIVGRDISTMCGDCKKIFA